LEIIDLPFFPFPRIVDNRRIPGYKFTWPRPCEGCDRQCESDKRRALSLCSYGVNYQRITERQIVFGFLLPGASTTRAQKKAMRQSPENRISQAELNRALGLLKSAQEGIDDEIRQSKKEIMEIYKEDMRFKSELLDLLKPEIQRNLAFLHDYKQFVSTVKQNINVVLETRYSSGEIDQLLQKALPSEGAIYWASSLMTEKLETAFLLLHPERLHAASEVIFRLHGMVLKYVRIYNASFQKKSVKLEVVGASSGEIKGESSAIGVIPQTLLDNALKYSERGSKVTVSFQETGEEIVLSVVSYGPKIDEDEKNKIFDIFYRGRNAIKAQEEGAGFGLHLAQFVAQSLGTKIVVQQSPVKSRFGYETNFSIKFPRAR
jgi:signal transduction histidine kinase